MNVRWQMIVAAAIATMLGACELALDLAGAKPDPTLQDAFRLTLGATLTLLAVHIANAGSNGPT